jgi:hypothetical protein
MARGFTSMLPTLLDDQSRMKILIPQLKQAIQLESLLEPKNESGLIMLKGMMIKVEEAQARRR